MAIGEGGSPDDGRELGGKAAKKAVSLSSGRLKGSGKVRKRMPKDGGTRSKKATLDHEVA